MEIITHPQIVSLQQFLSHFNERIEGNLICDVTPTNFIVNRMYPKIKNLQHLVKNKKKVCEIGINACHSLLLMLQVNPTAEYLLFDLKNHLYTEPCLDFVHKMYPNTKITVVYGNSVETIAEYIKNHPEEHGTYDLCHIDGGHTEDIFSHDYNNIKVLSKRDTPVIFDDYDMGEINNFVNARLVGGDIRPYYDDNIVSTMLHFIYVYN